MATVVKRPEALADLERIWLEGANEFGIAHAERVIERFEQVFNLLAVFRSIGLARQDLGEGIRLFPMREYPFLIFFRASGDGIEIIRILHSRRDYGQEMGQKETL